MKDIEIVVFNDKSWVRLVEYQKLDEELKNEKQSLAKRIYELQSDLSREKSKNEKLEQEKEKLKAQIEKMKIKKSCSNCKHYDEPFCRQENEIDYFKCENHSEWELAE